MSITQGEFISWLSYYIYNAFGIYVIYRFNTIFFDCGRVDQRKEFVAYCGYFLLISAIYQIWKAPALTVCANIAICFFVTRLYSEAIAKRLIISVLINALFFLFESVAYVAVIDYHLESAEFLLSFLSTLITCTFVRTLGQIVHKKEDRGLNISHWVAIFVVPIFSIGIAFILVLARYNMVFTDLGLLGLLIVNLLIFYLYDQLSESYIAKYEKAILTENNKAYRNELEMIKNADEKQRRLKHDLKNHVLTIEELVRKEEKDSIVNYLQKLQQELSIKGEFICTGNSACDSIVNYKLQKAIEKEIRIKTDITIPEQLNITEFDLTIILGNLLDNAIENAEKSQLKYIELYFYYRQGILYLKVRNSIANELKSSQEKPWYTKKEDKENHGFGLLQIEDTAKKYNGLFEISKALNACNANVMLYLDNEK